MLIDFNITKEITIPGMNNGTGMMTAKMYMDEQGKIIPCLKNSGRALWVTAMNFFTSVEMSSQPINMCRSC